MVIIAIILGALCGEVDGEGVRFNSEGDDQKHEGVQTRLPFTDNRALLLFLLTVEIGHLASPEGLFLISV